MYERFVLPYNLETTLTICNMDKIKNKRASLLCLSQVCKEEINYLISTTVPFLKMVLPV